MGRALICRHCGEEMVAQRLRQWIVHPDGTWVWSAEKPVGGAPAQIMFGRFEHSLPVALPDANDAKYPAFYLRVPVLADPLSLDAPGELSSVRPVELAYSRRRTVAGHYEWVLEA